MPRSRDDKPFTIPSDKDHLAPKGKFRLLGVDTFEGPFAEFVVGDYDDQADAIKEAKARRQPMVPFYVFSDDGVMLYSTKK